MENENMPQRKKKRRIWPIILLAFCFFISAAAGSLLASSSIFDLKKEPIKQIERMNFDTELIKAKDKSTILIMGVDMREDDVGRSDTMMIAMVDPKYDQAALMSIPRDTRVRIYGYGYDKINAAYAFGGEPLAEKTVENFLGIDIDHYVIINTNSFVKIIDAIGGIDIDVEKRMKYEDPWDDNGGLFINLFPGVQHMDGKKAVTYVRYRDSEGDIGRIKRQQKFIEACLDKVTSPAFIPRIPSVLREVVDAIDTDMTFRQLLELAGALKAAQQNGLETDMVPGYPIYIDEISYWIPYVDELQYAMAQLLDVSVDNRIKSRVEKVASEYNESIPSTAKKIPEGAETVGEPTRDYPPNYYYENQDDKNDTYDDNDNEEIDTRRDDNYYNEETESRRDDYYSEETDTRRDDDYYYEPPINSSAPSKNYEPTYDDRRENYYYDNPDNYNDRRENYYYDTPSSYDNYSGRYDTNYYDAPTYDDEISKER